MSTSAHHLAAPAATSARVRATASMRETVPAEARWVVHLTAEYGAYARTGGLGEAVEGLARAQARAGHHVVVFLPLYAPVRSGARDLRSLGRARHFTVGSRLESVRYFRDAGHRGGPHVVFVDAPAYFDRPELYGDGDAAYPDNHRRFALFSLAALHGASHLAPRPTVLHAHDWHTGLVPVYLRADPRLAAAFADTPVVFSVHNAGYQGDFPESAMADLGFDSGSSAIDRLDGGGRFNLLKTGITASDAVVTVSAAHAAELVTEVGGFGLHSDFRALGRRLSGVRNGIDRSTWNPATDPHIGGNFSRDDLSGKVVCKDALQAEYALPRRADVPVFVMSTRLVTQKGLDLILRSERVRSADAQFVFLGRGERRLHDALAALVGERPANVAVQFAFTDAREHRAVAGADFLLMPSLYEPCGLTQMRAQRYGAPVVARDVGGLRDTVDDGETGFMFTDYDERAFDGALGRALAAFADGEAYRAMQRHAMMRDFGWDHPARQYARVYDAAARQAAAVR